MNAEEKIRQLELENEQLKKDKQNMLKVIEQMKATSNRLIDRYIVSMEDKAKETVQ